MTRLLAVSLLLMAPAASMRVQTSTAAAVNPVRRVVSMLQSMQQKVAAEGEKEKELYNKYACYCKTGGAALAESIAAAETKLGELGPAIEEAKNKKVQLQEDLKQHKADREEAKTAMKTATELRRKEAAAFAKETADAKANIGAINSADRKSVV